LWPAWRFGLKLIFLCSVPSALKLYLLNRQETREFAWPLEHSDQV
jgi:hypothetical protein